MEQQIPSPGVVRWLPGQVQRLAGREREVATFVYKRGAATAVDVGAALSVEISNGAVRSMLVRLTNKGILRRELGSVGRGQHFVYYPALTTSEVKEVAIADFVRRYFNGSYLSLALEVIALIERTQESARSESARQLSFSALDQRPAGRLLELLARSSHAASL